MEKKKFWSYENTITIIFFFAIGFIFFDRLSINFLFSFMQEDFSISNTQIGLLSGALAITWSIAGPVGGILSDKVKNRKLMLAIFIIGFSLVSLLHGLASSFATLFGLRLIMGVLEGPVNPIASAILRIQSSPSRLGFNMGFITNTANAIFGNLLAPIVIVALATALSWQSAFFLTIVPGILIAIAVLMYVKNPSLKAKEQFEPSAENSKKVDTKKISLKVIFKSKNMWLAMAAFSFFMIHLIAFQVYAPQYIIQVKGFSASTMSLIIASFGLGFAVFGIIVPMLSDKYGRKPIVLIFSLFLIFTPIAVILIPSVPMLMLGVFFTASGLGIGSLLMSNIPSESVPMAFAGASIGIVVGVGEFIGGFINPIISGILADSMGLQAPLVISAVAAALVFVVGLFITESHPNKVAAKNPITQEAEELTIADPE